MYTDDYLLVLFLEKGISLFRARHIKALPFLLLHFLLLLLAPSCTNITVSSFLAETNEAATRNGERRNPT